VRIMGKLPQPAKKQNNAPAINSPTANSALADNAMTTLEDMLEMLQIDPANAGAEVKNNIIRLINAASSWIENMLGRKLGRAGYVHHFSGSDAQELVLRQYPIRSVEYVRDDAGKEIPPDEYDFTMTGNIGVLYKDTGWAFKGYIKGLANDYAAAKRYLEVRYTAGYILPKDGTEEEPSDLPYDIQGVIWGIVQQEFSIIRNGAQGLAAFSISDVSWTFDKEPRQSWTDTISRYMRW